MWKHIAANTLTFLIIALIGLAVVVCPDFQHIGVFESQQTDAFRRVVHPGCSEASLKARLCSRTITLNDLIN